MVVQKTFNVTRLKRLTFCKLPENDCWVTKRCYLFSFLFFGIGHIERELFSVLLMCREIIETTYT